MLTLVDDGREHTHAAPGQAHGDGAPVDLDELCRVAAQQMLAVALEAERRAYLAAHADVRGDDGHRLVVGNGHHRPREITTAAGRVEVTAPRVDDRRDGHRFTSAILPPYMRRSPKVTEVLPVLYLRGLSTNDFVPALEGFFGSAAGLSASTIQRLTEAWRAEHARWCQRDLSAVPEAWIAPPYLRQLRELVRYRAKLVALRSGLKAQVHAVLAKEGVAVPMTDLFGRDGMALLREVRLGTCYRMRIDSLLELIDAFDGEVAWLASAVARGCGTTPATPRSKPSPASVPRSRRCSSSRSATSVASPDQQRCARGPG